MALQQVYGRGYKGTAAHYAHETRQGVVELKPVDVGAEQFLACQDEHGAGVAYEVEGYDEEAHVAAYVEAGHEPLCLAAR